MKGLFLCVVSVVLVIWLAQQISSFLNDYQLLYIHEHHLREQDTAFYAAICVDVEQAVKTGSADRCHGIKDRHTISVNVIAFQKAVDKYNICGVECLKDSILNPTVLIVFGVLFALFLCLYILRFLQPQSLPSLPLAWTTHSNKMFPDTHGFQPNEAHIPKKIV